MGLGGRFNGLAIPKGGQPVQRTLVRCTSRARKRIVWPMERTDRIVRSPPVPVLAMPVHIYAAATFPPLGPERVARRGKRREARVEWSPRCEGCRADIGAFRRQASRPLIELLATGGEIFRLEGEFKPTRVVVIEFPSVEHAQAWYRSDAYQAIVSLRLEGSAGSVLIADGV